MAKNKANPDDPYRDTLADVAAWFGVSRGAAEEWHSSGGAPKKSRQGYNLREWAAWLARRRGNVVSKETPDYILKTIKIESAQFDLDVRKARYISVEEHDAIVLKVITTFIDAIDSAPVEFALSLPSKSGPQIKAIVRDWFNQMRRSISEKLYHEKQENHQNEVHQATQENQPVGDGDEVGCRVEINVLGGNGKTTAKGASSNGRALATRDHNNLQLSGVENRQGLRARG